ncbi:YCF48-related protein [Pseudomonas sp. FP2300]|uniref:WD40/YVTN/BNR-like repeat-containing protein n=1 Tax=Pseudomonas sp. FP2300 TaxID=2954090 RepID=UPI002735D664|nr:YCF48-related protein [Pseudomonas sp. FP2300]WLH65201.1 YCF48-related protein [Pseudomonas sp. FP2300]
MSKKKVGQIATAILLSCMGCFAHADVLSLPEVLNEPSVAANHPEKGYLLSVVRAGDRLVAVGESGRVILSDDSGKTWRQAEVPVNVLLTQVRFATAKEGWAIGHLGVVLHTADGGDNWDVQLDGVKVAQLFVEQAQREISQKGDQDEDATKALHQADFLLQDGPDKPFLTMRVEDAQRITIFGAFGMALRSLDGGKTWLPLQTKNFNPGSLHYYGSASLGGHDLVVGEQGLLIRRLDSGIYQSMDQPYSGTFFGVIMSDGVSVAFGLRGNAVRSLDQGESWQQIETGTSASIQGGLALKDGRIILLAENGQIVMGSQHSDNFHALDRQLAPAAEAIQISDDQLLLVGPSGVQTLSLSAGESAQ